MAVIQKIRNRYGKIAGGIIAVALISFIVSDARNGSITSLFGGHDNSVATVNGIKIDSKEYELRVKEYELLTTIYSQNQGPIDENKRAQIREQVMQQMQYDAVVNKICDKLGINVSEQEQKDMIYGATANPLVRQFQIEGHPVFVNPDTKQFDPGYVKGMEQQLAQNPKLDPYGKIKEEWEAVKAFVVRNARIDKFNTMMAASAYSPMYLAKRMIQDKEQMASIRYVKVPFTTIPDADAKVTDADIKAYMEKHKAIFETDQPTRTIEYVSFDVVPASADTARVLQSLNEMKAEFATTKDNQAFIGNKSDDASMYSEAYMSKNTFPSRYADTILSQPVGSIYGPYFENGAYKITKITDKKVLPDSVKCRHILVKMQEGNNVVLSDSAAKKRIDSVVAAINAGVPFDTMVVKVSNDFDARNPNPKGEYTFTLQQRPNISKTFGDFIFEGKTGEKKIVKADNSKVGGYVGYHYIEILEQKAVAPTVQVATVIKNLAPSDSTANAIFSTANEFAGKSANAADFDANVKKMNLDKRVGDNIKEGSFSIQGLGNAREIIKWAYTHKVGEISTDAFALNGQRYVVVKLASAQEKGLMALNGANRPMLEQRVRDERKADMIATKYKGQQLDAIAQASGAAVQQVDSVTLGNNMVPNLGYEPKVVGYAFYQGFQPNTVSPAIKGQGGVYFITVVNRTAIQADPMAEQAGMQQERMQEEMQQRNYVGQALQSAVLKSATIKYNPANF